MSHPLIRSTGAWMRDVISDEEVCRRVLAGETELFELLVRRHNQRLYRTARALVQDDDEAEEALQESYVSAWRNLSSFRGEAQFTTWMTKIVVRAAGVVAKRRTRAQELADAHAAESSVESFHEAAADSELDASEERALLERTIDTLPEAQRIVFVLRALEGLSTADVALDLGLSEANVKIRMHRARKSIAARLQERARRVGVWSFAAERCDRITARVMARVGAEARS